MKIKDIESQQKWSRATGMSYRTTV